MKINLFLLACLLAFAKIANGQDLHFSQPQFAPLHFNPALTGFLQGKFQHRFSVKYRDQWRSALENQSYQTQAASYDFRLCGKNSFWGFGAAFLTDQVGEPAFSTTQAQVAAAFHQQVGKDGFLSGGMLAGIFNFRLDPDGLYFREQFDGYAGFDPNRPSHENLPEQPSELVFDLGTGLRYQNSDICASCPRRFGFEAGAAVHHLNRPVFSFFEETTTGGQQGQLAARWVIHAGGSIPLSGHRAGALLLPRLALLFQELAGDSPHRQALLKMDVRKKMHKTDLTLGLGARLVAGSATADALLATAQVTLAERLTLGAAWDVNVSPLRKATNFQGALEVSLAWVMWENKDCIDCGDFKQH